MVDIDMSSPDSTGAVAYYFDTLTPSEPRLDHGHVSLVGAAWAAANYLEGLVASKGLQITRGPYLTQAPQTDLLPDGWQMVRALVWVEEFDLLVPQEHPAGVDAATVRINGREYELILPGRTIDYSKLCELAGQPEHATVTYRNAADRGRGEGTLALGDRIRVKPSGTVFDVAVTSGA
jgi:hypothetical protein